MIPEIYTKNEYRKLELPARTNHVQDITPEAPLAPRRSLLKGAGTALALTGILFVGGCKASGETNGQEITGSNEPVASASGQETSPAIVIVNTERENAYAEYVAGLTPEQQAKIASLKPEKLSAMTVSELDEAFAIYAPEVTTDGSLDATKIDPTKLAVALNTRFEGLINAGTCEEEFKKYNLAYVGEGSTAYNAIVERYNASLNDKITNSPIQSGAEALGKNEIYPVVAFAANKALNESYNLNLPDYHVYDVIVGNVAGDNTKIMFTRLQTDNLHPELSDGHMRLNPLNATSYFKFSGISIDPQTGRVTITEATQS